LCAGLISIRVQPKFWIGLGLIWFTGTGSLVSRSFNLLDRLEILASAAMDDFIEWIPPFEEIELVSLDFSEVGSHWMVFSVRSSNKSRPYFSSFFKNSPWHIVSKRVLFL